jgi:ComF family protein
MGDYMPPLSDLVRLFKYQQHIHLGAALVQVHLVQLLNRQSPGALQTPAWPDCLVPVPLHPDRIRSRGFNQAAVLTRHYSRALRCRADLATLVRTDNSATHQAGKTRRERLQPEATQFAVRKPLPGQRIALVDDVMTTGATLNAATQALLQAGAASVTRIVIARTP